jgi:signal peptidase II
MATERRSYRGYYYLIAALIFALDQATKLAIVRNIPLNRSVAVIPGFFGLSHVLNPGAAFSLFADSSSRYAPRLLITFACVVLVAIFVVLWRSGKGFALSNLALALIMGGAMGNLLDRLRIGSVIDFLMFKFGSYYYPDFNVADSAIVVGSLLLIAELFFHKQPSSDNQSFS